METSFINIDLERKAYALLEESADLTTTEQVEFLRGACKDKPDLLSHCLSIREHEVNDEDFMELVYGDTENTDESCDLTGKIVGNYRIEKKIGSGGTSDVCLAFRNDDVHHQPVALKIIRGWGNTRELKERMKRERKILSQFTHPHIANLLDGGDAEDGRPYFVLDYIQGQPITDYCKEKNLPLKDRLVLFTGVCSAVSAAHKKFTLHRDLKPANILVTDEGVPKLLDFGIAKILDEKSSGDTRLTQFYSPMTPQYASPEQMRQEPLSVASDQYSLGVLLYELITDSLPYDEAEDKILNVPDNADITPPSARVSEQNDRTVPGKKRLIKQLKGDLDAIVMKAIHPDAEKRYSSVKELANDIHRYSNNQTVRARKNRCWYRISRLFKRHKKNVVFVVVFACANLFVTITQQVRIIHERNHAIIERKRFDQTQDLLLGLFKFSHLEKNRQEDITSMETLDKYVEVIRHNFSGQPMLKVALLSTMGRAYQNLQLDNKAFDLHSESLALQQAH